ncbi:MAG TPA: GNAT family N-acetyltransferase [Dictyobacter sp.]|nr:GNAT family N-acetyltransferase [Dictyobacter sp.]
MLIRPARPQDASVAALLIRNAIDDIAYSLTGMSDEQDVLTQLAAWFRLEGNRLSYQNALIAEWARQIAGLILLYHGSDAQDLDYPIIAWLRDYKQDPTITIDVEADADDFYIDTLSVFSHYAGNGIGRALIAAAELRCKELGYHKLALNVDTANERAYRLYQHLGFQTDKTILINGHPYHHQVKYLL